MLRYAILFSNRDGFGSIFVSEPTTLPYFGDTYGLLAVDIDGDGRLDLVYIWQDTSTPNNDLWYATLKSNGKQFEVSTARSFGGYNPGTLPMFIAMNVSGSGRTDLVYPFADLNGCLNLQVMLSNGTEYTAQPIQPTPFPVESNTPDKLMPATITGSPRQDLVYAYWADGEIHIVSLISNGHGFIPAATERFPLSSNQYSRFLPVNLNGDDLTDVALVCQPSDYDEQVAYFFVSDGTRIRQPDFKVLPLSIPHGGGTRTPMDMTGDVRLDLLHTCILNNGSFLLQPYLCRDGGFEPANPLPNDFGGTDPRILALSIDGSAKSGFLRAQRPSALNASIDSNGWHFKLFKAGPIYPGLMSAINNGIGGRTSFSYESLATPGVYSESSPKSSSPKSEDKQPSALSQLSGSSGLSIPVGKSGASQQISYGLSPPKKFVTVPVYVVTTMQRSDGRGDSYIAKYQYAKCPDRSSGPRLVRIRIAHADQPRRGPDDRQRVSSGISSHLYAKGNYAAADV